MDTNKTGAQASRAVSSVNGVLESRLTKSKNFCVGACSGVAVGVDLKILDILDDALLARLGNAPWFGRGEVGASEGATIETDRAIGGNAEGTDDGEVLGPAGSGVANIENRSIPFSSSSPKISSKALGLGVTLDRCGAGFGRGAGVLPIGVGGVIATVGDSNNVISKGAVPPKTSTSKSFDESSSQ
jgi:hypothetical protein